MLEGYVQNVGSHAVPLQGGVVTFYYHVQIAVSHQTHNRSQFNVTADLYWSQELHFVYLSHHREKTSEEAGGAKPADFITVP